MRNGCWMSRGLVTTKTRRQGQCEQLIRTYMTQERRVGGGNMDSQGSPIKGYFLGRLQILDMPTWER